MGGNITNLQKLLPTETIAEFRSTLQTKYGVQELPRDQTIDLSSKGQAKAASQEIEEIVIPILKNNKNIRARFELVTSLLAQLSSTILLAFEQEGLGRDLLLNIAKADLQGYQNVKLAILNSPDLSSELIQRTTQIIDKLVYYEDTIFGIVINKSNRLEEIMDQIDIEDFHKNLHGVIVAFIFALVSLLAKEFDEKKLSKVLALGMRCSEQIESYIDTMDILCDKENLESISQSEKYYNLS